MTLGIDRSRMAGRVAALLLATTCLTPFLIGVVAPALADGGTGGAPAGGNRWSEAARATVLRNYNQLDMFI